jgi:hypothetical protein
MISNSYIPPQRRNGSNESNSSSNKFSSKDELLANLGIRQPNNLHFTDKDFSIRIFNDEITAFPEAERLFMKDADEFKLKKIIIGNETLQHYHLKNSFFDSADLSILYTDSETSGRIIIQFGVSLEESNVGGSISYRDLGLINRASVGAFVSKFPEIAIIPGLNNKLVYIINTISTHYRDELSNAMRREIIEECTPNGEDPIDVGSLTFVKTKAEKNGKRLNIRYIFRGCRDFKKVREMDIFPMIFEGTLIDTYYIYGTGNKEKDHKYLVNAPYSADDFDEEVGEHLITVEELEAATEKPYVKNETSRSSLLLSNNSSIPPNKYELALSESVYNNLYNSITNKSTASLSAITPRNEIVMPPSISAVNNTNTASTINNSNKKYKKDKTAIQQNHNINIAFGYRPKTIHFNRTARKSSKSRTNTTRKNN